jgi:cysteine-rich repeat protein
MKSVFSFLGLLLIFSFVVGFVGAEECIIDGDCDDGDVCNGEEYCDAGSCYNDGVSLDCDDYDVCNGEETCDPINGCTAGTALACDDEDENCYIIGCDPYDGCHYTFNDVEGPVTSDVDVDPIYNNGVFDILGLATDECSAIEESEYFVGSSGYPDCGTPGTGSAMSAADGNFNEFIEELIKEDATIDKDGTNWACVQSKDEEGLWGNCDCIIFESDTIPPERIIDITLDGELNPVEWLICGDDPLLQITVCDSESWIQGGEFFLNMWVPPEDIPAPWTGYWMDVVGDQFYDDGWHCANLEKYIPLEGSDEGTTDNGEGNYELAHLELAEGTHWINQIRGKDIVENWGKIWNQNLNYSFIKDTMPPLVYKELLPLDGVLFPCDAQQQMMGKTLTHGCSYVKSGTLVNLSADDSTFVDDHEFAGQVVIYYKVWWSEFGDNWEVLHYGQSAPDEWVNFTLIGDSYHLVEFWAVDACGWESEHYWELDIIDELAPESLKVLGDPKVDCSAADIALYGYDDCAYVTQDTLVSLTCSDVEPHPVGGENIYYTIDWKLNWADEWELGDVVDGGSSVEFDYWRDSFHRLTWWCVDDLGNVEVEHVELDMVDSQAPEVEKVVGFPQVLAGYSSAASQLWQSYDYYEVSDPAVYITQNTEISLTCEDLGPHPVDDVEIYCKYYNDYYLVQDWELCMEPFTYDEDTFHELYYYCVDALGNEGPVHYELDYVDTLAPVSDYDLMGPVYYEQGTGKTFIDDASRVVLGCYDQQPHPVGEDYIMYKYTVDGILVQDWVEYTQGDDGIHFPEESHHVISYYCVDLLGNTESENVLEVYVDHTKPVTTKTYGEPLYEAVVGGYPKWITKQTPITLTANDYFGWDHDSGVADTFYRVRVLNNPLNWHYCYEGCEGWDGVPDYLEMNVPTPWQNYDVPFTVAEDSCHVIEYYSVDNVDKTEEVNRQCVFVDTQVPVTTKTIGEPKVPLDIFGGDNDWVISGDTEITLECIDGEPHPVNDVTLLWRWRYSELGELWTDWSDDIIYDGVPITFTQSSYHEIEYWCVDALGNEEEHQFEIDAVDLTPPTSWKEVGEPKVLIDPNCDPQNEICDYWITQGTNISLYCEDGVLHPSGVKEILWRYDLDGLGWSDWVAYDNPITFGEDSEHTLEWKCIDNFGNEEAVRSELDNVDTQGPNVTRKFARVNDGEIIEGGSVGNEVVVAITSEDTIKLCAELVDYKQTWDAGVGIMEVGYKFTGLPDPELVWDDDEQAYCVEKDGDEIRECGGDCGWWRFEVQGADLLYNFGEWTNGLEIIVDNVAPVGSVLNPHAGNYYRDEVPFQVYAPAVDFGGDYCSICDNGYDEDCPASGVDYCDLYAIDYAFENLNQSAIKDCYLDLWTYFQQVGANPNVAYLGQVPYVDGVCEGTAALPLDSGMTGTVFLGIDYVDKAGNRGNELFGYHLQLALNPWFSPITMNIDNDGPLVAVLDSNLPGPLTSSGDGDNVFVEVEVVEYASGFDSCWAEVYEDDEGELGDYVGVADIIGTEPEYNLCRINGAVPDGLASGNYFVKVNVRDELFNIGNVVLPMIVDNTRPTMSVVAPMEGEVYGEMFPVSLNVEDSQSEIVDDTVMFRISEIPVLGNLYCVMGNCEDTGWVSLDEQDNGLYATTISLTEYEISGEGRYVFDAVACDALYVFEGDTELGFSMGNSRTDAHCRMISEHGQVVEEYRPACDDGVDNENYWEGDGFTDFPADDGCYSAEDDDEEAVCGNGYMEEDEECDDGNNDNGDGCSDVCVIEYCGDGVINNGEECEASCDCSIGFYCYDCLCVEEEEEEQGGNALKINEFLSDTEGDGSEWIELYNPTDSEFDLTGGTLSDGGSWVLVLDGTIDAYGFRVFDGFYNKLNDGGDIIKLKSPFDELVDSVAYGDWDDGDTGDNAPDPAEGESCGRFSDGYDTDVDSDDFYLLYPTPGAANEFD